MFRSSHLRKAFSSLDFTHALAEQGVVSPSQLGHFGLEDGKIQALAWDSVQSLLAIGTANGCLAIVGAQGVILTFSLRPALAVKYLVFRSGTSQLCCIDARDTLSVFDVAVLDGESRPTRSLAWSARSTVTAIDCSPAHSMLILGLRDGTVDFYDLDRGHPTPYRIQNLWLAQDELLRRSGVPGAPSRRHIPSVVDIVQHPLDLNRIFIAYEGGVALYSIREAEIEQTYTVLIPPGATGGGNDADMMVERRPNITCIAMRPDGLVLAAGTEDGCIAFWAIDDGDKPLLVRTLDREDVDRIDANSFFDSPIDGPIKSLREPIYRLSWSGFPGDGVLEKMAALAGGAQQPATQERARGSMLSILGGLLPSDMIGVHVIHFPAEAGQLSTTASAHETLRATLSHVGHSVYGTSEPPEDFVLLAQSPHYGRAYDPFAMVTLQPAPTMSNSEARCLKARHFPPSLSSEPADLSLPTLLTSPSLPVHSQLLSISTMSLQRLYSASHVHLPPRATIKGGTAKARYDGEGPGRLVKEVDGRLLLAVLRPLRLYLADASSALLAGAFDGSLRSDYPSPLLDLDLTAHLRHPALSSLIACRMLRETADLLSVVKTSFAGEACEISVALSTGEVIIGRIDHMPTRPSALDRAVDEQLHGHGHAPQAHEPPASNSPPPHVQPLHSPSPQSSPKPSRSGTRLFGSRSTKRKSSQPTAPTKQRDRSTAHLHEVEEVSFDGLRGVCAISGVHEQVTALALSDVGFVAVAWASRLLVVDLRGPDVVLEETLDADMGEILVLDWSVSALATDPEACLRLTICHRNGTICVFTFHHSLDTWVVAGPPLFAKHESLEHPLLARMLSPRGDILEATVNALEGAIRGFTPSHQNLPDLPPSFLLLVSARAAAIKGSLTESSLAKVDFSEAIAAAEVVTRHESAFLAVCTAAGAVSLFTLPQLQPFNRIPFTSPTSSDQHTSLSASIATDGDYILLDGHQAHFRTLFARNRGRFPPSLTLHDPALHGPARPTMPKLSTTGQAAGGMLSGFSSWLTRPAAMTGDAFDALIAGPNRPAKKEPPKSVAAPARARSASASKYRQDAPLANRNLLEAKNASGSAHASARETNEMLEEREDRLAQLNEGLSNLATGARDALNEARKTALQQGLKSKFNSLF